VLTAFDLKPGDILYLPRGQYHDALATGAASVHLAVGATEPIGIDLLSLLFEDAVGDPAFRRRLPAADRALETQLGALASSAQARLTSSAFRERLAALRAGFNAPRGGFPPKAGFRDDPVKPLDGPGTSPGKTSPEGSTLG
jgi:ribosomal protein L16 Arg81 hydroxylase